MLNQFHIIERKAEEYLVPMSYTTLTFDHASICINAFVAKSLMKKGSFLSLHIFQFSLRLNNSLVPAHLKNLCIQ